jgi:hypothetical protein
MPAAVRATGSILLAVIVAVATAVEDARTAGIRHPQRISGRDAFAGRVAFEVVGESARTELDSLMAEWRRFPDSEVIETVERCHNDASKQVEALRTAGKLDAARVGWACQVRPARPGLRRRTPADFHTLAGGISDTTHAATPVGVVGVPVEAGHQRGLVAPASVPYIERPG